MLVARGRPLAEAVGILLRPEPCRPGGQRHETQTQHRRTRQRPLDARMTQPGRYACPHHDRRNHGSINVERKKNTAMLTSAASGRSDNARTPANP